MAKSFRQASSFISIEENVINDALQWLADHQATNGSFPEVGKVYHSEMQGGSTYELTLTAYTLIAFSENVRTTSQFRSAISRSVDYIVRNLYRITDDSYALALCTYALHLAEHPEKDQAFAALESNAQTEGMSEIHPKFYNGACACVDTMCQERTLCIYSPCQERTSNQEQTTRCLLLVLASDSNLSSLKTQELTIKLWGVA